MTTSNRGLDLIKQFEGFSSKAYIDLVGLPTIGYGTLIDRQDEEWLLSATITREEATRLLKQDVQPIEQQLNRMIIQTVSQNQFDALVSFCYNLGTGALRRSTLLKKINCKPNDPTIKREFLRWVYAGGKRVQGLVNRRTLESELYFC